MAEKAEKSSGTFGVDAQGRRTFTFWPDRDEPRPGKRVGRGKFRDRQTTIRPFTIVETWSSPASSEQDCDDKVHKQTAPVVSETSLFSAGDVRPTPTPTDLDGAETDASSTRRRCSGRMSKPPAEWWRASARAGSPTIKPSPGKSLTPGDDGRTQLDTEKSGSHQKNKKRGADTSGSEHPKSVRTTGRKKHRQQPSPSEENRDDKVQPRGQETAGVDVETADVPSSAGQARTQRSRRVTKTPTEWWKVTGVNGSPTIKPTPGKSLTPGDDGRTQLDTEKSGSHQKNKKRGADTSGSEHPKSVRTTGRKKHRQQPSPSEGNRADQVQPRGQETAGVDVETAGVDVETADVASSAGQARTQRSRRVTKTPTEWWKVTGVNGSDTKKSSSSGEPEMLPSQSVPDSPQMVSTGGVYSSCTGSDETSPNIFTEPQEANPNVSTVPHETSPDRSTGPHETSPDSSVSSPPPKSPAEVLNGDESPRIQGRTMVSRPRCSTDDDGEPIAGQSRSFGGVKTPRCQVQEDVNFLVSGFSKRAVCKRQAPVPPVLALAEDSVQGRTVYQWSTGKHDRNLGDLSDWDVVLQTIHNLTQQYRDTCGEALETSACEEAITLFGENVKCAIQQQIDIVHKYKVDQSRMRKMESTLRTTREELLSLQREDIRMDQELDQLQDKISASTEKDPTLQNISTTVPAE